MELRTCEYCGMEFSKEHTICPLCGRPVLPASADAADSAPIYSRKKSRSGGKRVRGGRFAARTVPVHEKPASEPKPEKEKPQKENVYAIPRWMMIVICILLGAGVLAGAVFAMYNIGYFDGFLDLSQNADKAETPSASVAGEAQYTNEEDYQQTLQQTQQQSQPIPCTGLTLGASSITFDEIEQFYNITATVRPENCTDKVVYSSSDIQVASVSQQGKIVAVGGGVAEITATCGSYVQTCLVTCDFISPQGGSDQVEPPVLSSAALSFTYPGQQATLLVNNVETDAEITFASSDDAVASVSSSGVVTAVGSGSATITATVYDLALTCEVSCTLEDSAESGSEDENCTISNEDVTMTIVGEYFKLTLRDSDGDAVKGVSWTSSDTSICTVDEDGIVYAVGRGTTTVYTTYGGKNYECIVRCPIS